MPLAKLDLLAGYGIAFALVAALQAALVSLVAIWLLDVHVAGSVALVVALAIANAILGTAMGLLTSAFARTEFQAVQFLPAFLLPQLLLCGLLVPRDQMAPLLEWISYALPMTYAYDAMHRVATTSGFSRGLAVDLAVTVGATLVALIAGAATLRRRTA
jgi:ABC-2 type transport system permease protein